MSREIKFRAWDKELKFMVDPAKYFVEMDGSVWFNLGEDEDNLIEQTFKLELMQYTGLKDKNGTEIYEGDIIRLENGESGAVEYGECGCTADDNFCGGDAIGFHVMKEILGNSQPWSDNATDSKRIEIIGNMYESPELLEENE